VETQWSYQRIAKRNDWPVAWVGARHSPRADAVVVHGGGVAGRHVLVSREVKAADGRAVWAAGDGRAGTLADGERVVHKDVPGDADGGDHW